MSRASEAARKAYPVLESKIGIDRTIAYLNRRIGYEKGYEQAEKELIHLAQLWADSGDANVMSFEQFLKCYEAQSNK